MNNTDLRVAGVNMLVVDWNYVANPATPSQGSQLEDAPRLRFYQLSTMKENGASVRIDVKEYITSSKYVEVGGFTEYRT